MNDLSGKVIRGYELQTQLGAGGFGAVYLAFQPAVKREVAIKIILPQYANHPDFIRNFEAEAQLVARLESARIVPLYDYWREPDSAYLVMRYLRGGSLRSSLEADGPWSLEETNRLLYQIAEALTVAHRNRVIHRDLKPDNILLDEDKNAYLADFGIAKDLTGLTPEEEEDELIVGSPLYISPEQIQSQRLTPQTDLYSLGIVLYEVLTGTRPFTGDTSGSLIMQHLTEPLPNLVEFRPDLPPALNVVVQRATAKNPAERYPDAFSLAAAFQDAAESLDHEETTIIRPPVSLDYGETSVGLEVAVIENPYKGLQAFQEADADDFFGRQRLVERLLSRLGDEAESPRFLSVVGPSGSGKSSVVKAGLIPSLRSGALNGSDDWFITEMVPGTHPLEEIEAALLRIAVNPPDSLLALLNEDARGLARAVKRVVPGDNEVLLVIDQFEEVFTMVEDEQERAHFLNNLLEAAADPRSRVRILLTLRADFYDRPLLYPEFGELVRQSTEVVLPLNAEELEQAIRNPAERVGLQLEPGLVTAIIGDIGEQPGALPLLQYALSELYERRDGNRLTTEAYEASGRVIGALARRAEELYKQADSQGQLLIRQLLLRLVTLGEGTEDTRRRVQQLELLSGEDARDEHMLAIIQRYGKYRLLTFDRDPTTRTPTVEVAHEALIRQWPRLRGWIESNREDLQIQRRLTVATQEWLNAGQDASFLASGARLSQFESWAEDTELSLNQQEQDYLHSSLAERQEREAEEAARQAHEATLERRSRQRLQLLVVVMALAVVVALLLSGFAFSQRDVAQRSAVTATVAQGQALMEADNAATAAAVAEVNAEEARSLALVSSAELALRNNDTELAIILALEANKDDRSSVETRRTLASAAYAPGARRLFAGHSDWVNAVAYSPDERMAISGGRDNSLILWDLDTGEQIRTFTGHTDWIYDVAFSPDGRYVVSASQDRTLILWDVETGEMVRQFEGHDDTVTSVAFSPDGSQILSGSYDGTLILWDVETGAIIHRMKGHTAEVQDVAFSKSGFTAASGGSDNLVILWNVQTGEPLLTFGADGTGHSSAVYAVAFTPDDAGLISASDDHTLILWNFESTDPVRRYIGHSARVTDVAFDPSGNRFISSAEDNTIILWDTATGAILHRFGGQSGPMFSIDMSADGSHFLSGGWDTNVRLWDIYSGAEIRRFTGHTAPVYWVKYSPDGKQILSASEDGTLILWDAETGQQIRQLIGHEGRVNAVDFSPDGKRALSGGDDMTMILWDLETGQIIRRFEGHTNAVWVVKFSPDGQRALSGSKDNSLILWDLNSGEQIRRFIGHRWWINDVEFLPDGHHAISASFDYTMILWDLDTGEQIRSFEGHKDWVRSVAITPDGKEALSASADSTMILWDIETGRQIRQYEGHDTQIQSVALSPDGKLAISGSNDTTLILWDVATGAILQRFSGHDDVIRSVDFSPDGQSVISGSGDDTVRMWRIILDKDALVAWVQANRYVRDFTCAERQRYTIDPPCEAPTAVPDTSRQAA